VSNIVSCGKTCGMSQVNPSTGEVIGTVRFGTVEDYEKVVSKNITCIPCS